MQPDDPFPMDDKIKEGLTHFTSLIQRHIFVFLFWYVCVCVLCLFVFKELKDYFSPRYFVFPLKSKVQVRLGKLSSLKCVAATGLSFLDVSHCLIGEVLTESDQSNVTFLS